MDTGVQYRMASMAAATDERHHHHDNDDMQHHKEEDDIDDDSDDDHDVAFAAVDFSGVNFDETVVTATFDDDADADAKLLAWERATPFAGFAPSSSSSSSSLQGLQHASDNNNNNNSDDSVGDCPLLPFHRTAHVLLAEGKYAEVLLQRTPSSLSQHDDDDCSVASRLFSDTTSSTRCCGFSSVRRLIRERVVAIGSESVAACVELELIAVAALNLFLQNNYTGPSSSLLIHDEKDEKGELLGIHPHPCFAAALATTTTTRSDDSNIATGNTAAIVAAAAAAAAAATSFSSSSSSILQNAVLAELAVDGEWPCQVCHTPYFLLIARSILTTLLLLPPPPLPAAADDDACDDDSWSMMMMQQDWTTTTTTTTHAEGGSSSSRTKQHKQQQQQHPNGAADHCRETTSQPLSLSEQQQQQLNQFFKHAAALQQRGGGVWLWSARACVAHERLLQARRPTETLWAEAHRTFAACLQLYDNDNDDNDSDTNTTNINSGSDIDTSSIEKKKQAAVVQLEWGLAQHHFDRPGMGKKAFAAALQRSGLDVLVTGAVGKRTKFQQQATAQMVVRAKSLAAAPAVSAAVASTADPSNCAPSVTEKDLIQGQMIEHSEEGILLERIKFEEEAENEVQELNILDQAILLAMCLDVKNSNPSDGLTGEEMGAFLARVLDHHDDWMVYSTALLERAWLEFERSHARERAILQMQALADQHTNRLTITQSTRESIENSAPVQERLRNLHSIVYPPRWAMVQDLADRYASIGIVTTAAELYTEIELWDSVVECYRRAGRVSHAETIVREQLAVNETPRMWAALGDLTKEPEYYERAITLSKGRFSDAYLALGEHYFGKGDLETAAGHYEMALKVRPLIPTAWFRLGAISMQLGRWQNALRAFSEVVLQKPEEAEAWANIAAVHMHNKHPAEAYPALNESLKHMRSNWRVWVSKLYTCLDLHKYDEAIQACHTLLDLRAQKQASDGIPPLEEKCVRAIVGGALQQFHGAREVNDVVAMDSSRRTLSRVHGLLDRISGSSSADSDAWVFETMTVFHEQTGQDSEKVLDTLTKEYRALQSNASWEKDNALVQKVCLVVSHMVHIYKQMTSSSSSSGGGGGREGLMQARFALRGVIQKVQTARPDDATVPQEVKRLEVLLLEIDEALLSSPSSSSSQAAVPSST